MAKDPDLQTFLADLNKTFLEEHRNNIAEIEKIRANFEDAQYIELKNGSTKTYKIKDVIPTMYYDIKEIKESTEVLVDAHKVHKVFKKYKLYPMSIIITLYWIWVNVIYPVLPHK